MNDKPKKHIVILHESFGESITKDFVTFGSMAAMMWFNHAYLAGSTVIDVLFIIGALVVLTGRRSAQVYSGTVAGAKKYLEDLGNE